MKRIYPNGFTMVELLVGMLLSAIIVSALLYFFSGSITSYRSQIGHIFATADARNQVQRIANVIRNSQDNGSNRWLTQASDTAVTVWTDITGDGTLEQVQYIRPSSSSPDLQRVVTDGSGTTTTTVATRLSGSAPVFVYYDSNGSAIASEASRTADAVKTIGISLTLSVPESNTITPQTTSTKITPRQKQDVSAVSNPVADGTREVTIEVPRGTPPSVSDNARIVIKNMSTGSTVVNKDVSMADLNDGRLRVYGTNDYAVLNYKSNSTLGVPAGWYVWFTWGVPVQQHSIPFSLSLLSSGSYWNCLNKTLSQALASSSCVISPYKSLLPYKAILTYTEGGYNDHVMDIKVKAPVLTSFTSTTADGTYGAGTSINIRATYDENIAAGSTMTVGLDTGVNVVLNSVSGSTLSGTYTVGAEGSGQNSADLNVSSIVSESVTDTLTPSTTRTNSTIPASPNNLWDTSTIVVNTVASAPILTKLDSTKGDGSYGAGVSINITATYHEPIAYGSTMTVRPNVGVNFDVVLNTVSGNTLSGTYTVANGHNSSDLSIDSIVSESVKDLATPVNTRTDSVVTGLSQGNFANNNIIVDTTAPAAPTALPVQGTYNSNQNIALSAEAGATIKYTTDGVDPSQYYGTVYTSPILVTVTTTIKAIAIDAAGNVSSVMTQLYTIDKVAPTISGILAYQGKTDVRVLFVTNEAGSTQLEYGTTVSYGTITSETDTSPRVLRHTVVASGLACNTLYNYRVISRDAAGNTATSANGTFTTTPCTLGNGPIARDVVGEYENETDSPLWPIFTKGSAHDGQGVVNQFGLYGPNGMAIDTTNHRLFVADTSNNRVLVYALDSNDKVQYTNPVPVNVLGQPNLTSATLATTQAGMKAPKGLVYDSVGQKLFVADSTNNRVLVFDVASVTNGENAINVLGQANFTTATAATTQPGMSAPAGLTYDSTNKRLFVGDYSNNRVLVFDLNTITNGENAINVLGKANFTTNTAATTQAGMSGPTGVSYDGSSKLFVADYTNNRVLVFDVASITNGENAINVLGQANFTTGTYSFVPSAANMYNPSGFAYDSTSKRLFVTNYSSHRVLVFDVNAITNGENAVNVLGQANFTTANLATTRSGMWAPYGLTYDSANKRLFVSDSTNNRVLLFDTP